MGFGSSREEKPKEPPASYDLKALLTICKEKCILELNKKKNEIKKKKEEIVDSLKKNNVDMAMAKMDNLILAENYVTVYEILDRFTEILKERCVYIVTNNECPTDLRNHLDSVIFAASRLEIKELKDFREKIKQKYGEAYIVKAENNVDRYIEQVLYEKIKITIFPNELKKIRLKQLCQEKKINYISQEEIPQGDWEATDTNLDRNPYESMRPELPTQSFVQRNSSTNNQTGPYPNYNQMQSQRPNNDGFPRQSQNQFQQGGFTNQSQQGGFPGPRQSQNGGFPGPSQFQQGGFTNQSQQGGFPGPRQSQQGGFPGPSQSQQGGFTNQSQKSGFSGQYNPQQQQNQTTNNPFYENNNNSKMSQNPYLTNNGNTNNSFHPPINNTSMKNSTQNKQGNGSIIPSTLISDTIPIQDPKISQGKNQSSFNDQPPITVENILDNTKTTLTKLVDNQNPQAQEVDVFGGKTSETIHMSNNNVTNPQPQDVDAFGGKTSETIHMSAQNPQIKDEDVFGGKTSETMHMSAQIQQPNEEEIFGGKTSETIHLSKNNNNINNSQPKEMYDYFGGNTGQTMHASVANPDNKENPFEGGDPLDVPTVPIKEISQLKIGSNNPFAEGNNPFDNNANISDPFGGKTITDEEDEKTGSIKKSGK